MTSSEEVFPIVDMTSTYHPELVVKSFLHSGFLAQKNSIVDPDLVAEVTNESYKHFFSLPQEVKNLAAFDPMTECGYVGYEGRTSNRKKDDFKEYSMIKPYLKTFQDNIDLYLPNNGSLRQKTLELFEQKRENSFVVLKILENYLLSEGIVSVEGMTESARKSSSSSLRKNYYPQATKESILEGLVSADWHEDLSVVTSLSSSELAGLAIEDLFFNRILVPEHFGYGIEMVNAGASLDLLCGGELQDDFRVGRRDEQGRVLSHYGLIRGTRHGVLNFPSTMAYRMSFAFFCALEPDFVLDKKGLTVESFYTGRLKGINGI